MSIDTQTTFRPTLFWDVNPETLDTQADAPFIIGRVLDIGNTDEWRAIRDMYGIERITDVAKEHTFVDRRSAVFWAHILSLSPNELTCTRRPFHQTLNAFLNR